MNLDSAPRRVDVVVVGAGAIGVACAVYTAAAGASVVLIEADRIGKGCSSGNAGHISPSDAIPLAAPGVVGQALSWLLRPNSPFSLRPQASLSFWLWLLRFARSCRGSDLPLRIAALGSLGSLSAHLVQGLSVEDRIASGYRPSGLLNIYVSKRGLSAGRHDAELLGVHGIDASVLNGDDARQLEPLLGPAVQGAVHLPADGLCDPEAFVHTLAEVARRNGVVIVDQAPVEAIVRQDGIVKLTTHAGVWAARRVVLASGSELPRLAGTLGLRVPILPGKGYSVDTNAQPQVRLPLLLFEQRTAVTPFGDFTRFAGRMEIGTRRRTVRKRQITSLLSAASAVLPETTIDPIKPGWAGLRPCTPDGLPIIGFADGRKDILVAGGHAMLGITLAAGTGAMVADLVLDRVPAVDCRPFRLDRFN